MIGMSSEDLVDLQEVMDNMPDEVTEAKARVAGKLVYLRRENMAWGSTVPVSKLIVAGLSTEEINKIDLRPPPPPPPIQDRP